MNETKLHEIVTKIVGVFLGLPEAEPDDDIARMYMVDAVTQADSLAETLLKRGTDEQVLCFDKFGSGHVELKFDWTGLLPKFEVVVVSKYNHAAGLPADQAHRTWQRLRARCAKQDIPVEVFEQLVRFSTPRQTTMSRGDFELISIAMMPDGAQKEARIEQFMMFVPKGMSEYVGYALRYLRHHVENSSVQ